MGKRMVSAFVGIVILAVLYYFKSDILFNMAAVTVAIMGLNEFYHALRQIGCRPIEMPGYLCCLLMGLIGFVSYEKILLPTFILLMPVLFFIFSLIYVWANLKIKITDVACSFFGILYIPVLMAFLVLTWHMNNGYLFTWFIFGGAWMSDTLAFFIGKFFGKHKVSKISPNKSVEGCIAGLFGGALFYGVYTYVLNTYFLAEIGGTELSMGWMTFLGAIVSAISQIGDFMASAVKRQCNIKDFGNIMPGHGGVLDRFDSILLIAPLVFLLFEFVI